MVEAMKRLPLCRLLGWRKERVAAGKNDEEDVHSAAEAAEGRIGCGLQNDAEWGFCG
jgi:hypothetical protein